MNPFIGNIEARMDAKGRVFVPSSFRKILQQEGDRFILRNDIYQPCLILYPESEWRREIETLTSRLNLFSAKDKMLFRAFVAEAETITLDANGRILIPRRLLQAATIEEGVRFIGMGQTIELWNAENTQKPFLSPAEMMHQMEEILGNNRKEENHQ